MSAPKFLLIRISSRLDARKASVPTQVCQTPDAISGNFLHGWRTALAWCNG
jgi:hypothetical protein